MLPTLNMLPMNFVNVKEKCVIAFNLDLPYPIRYEQLIHENGLSALGYSLVLKEIRQWGKATPLPEGFVIELSSDALDQLLIDLETNSDGLMDGMFMTLPKSRQQRYLKMETGRLCQYKNIGVNHHSLLLTREVDDEIHVSIAKIDDLQYSFMAA